MQKQKNRRGGSTEDRAHRGVWEDDFENISSSTQGTPRRPDFMEERIRQDAERKRAAQNRQGRKRPQPARSRAVPQELPQWDVPPRRRTSPVPQDHSPHDRKKGKKRMAAGARRVMLFLTVAVMAVATALLAIFLLFKVSDIQVTGDAIEGVTQEEVITISGCEIGDNLVFLSSGAAKRRLEEKIAYVQNAKIIKHFPNRVEIQLTAAQVAASVYGDGGWLYVNEDGKILEKRDAPQSGVMQIIGLSPSQTQPGKNVSVEDEDTQAAYQAILSAMLEVRADETGAYGGLNMNGFTLLDMSDLSNIRMFYEDRVEFKMGSALELDYKVKAGCRFLLEMTGRETGVMDLSSAGETKRAYFTPGELSLPTAPAAQPAGGETEPDPAPTQTPGPERSPRTEGIPDAPYAGN